MFARHPTLWADSHPPGQTRQTLPRADTPTRQTPLWPGRHLPPPRRRPLQRTVRILLECILVVKKILEDISPFCGVTDTPCFGILVTSPLGFKARVGSLIRTSSATPADLLWPAWQPSSFVPCTCEQALVGLKLGAIVPPLTV